MSNKIVWTIKELVEVLRQRQLNKFDCNFGVSGKRGDGKSTLILKIFKRFKKYGFNQKKHQVYAQDDVMRLLATQTFSFCWDDEAINSGYKRDFQREGQKILIKLITNYRDNFNIYGSALPFFYSLDKALRELLFMHLHVIERGLAVILLPLPDQVHSQDPWDTDNNIKVETKEYIRMKKNPGSAFRYNRFSTFAGYLYFGPMSPREEEIYKKIKQEKRNKVFKGSIGLESQEKPDLYNKLFEMLNEGKLTRNGLIQVANINNLKYNSLQSRLSQMLRDKGEVKRTLGDFLVDDTLKGTSNNLKGDINEIVPDFSA